MTGHLLKCFWIFRIYLYGSCMGFGRSICLIFYSDIIHICYMYVYAMYMHLCMYMYEVWWGPMRSYEVLSGSLFQVCSVLRCQFFNPGRLQRSRERCGCLKPKQLSSKSWKNGKTAVPGMGGFTLRWSKRKTMWPGNSCELNACTAAAQSWRVRFQFLPRQVLSPVRLLLPTSGIGLSILLWG